MRWCALVDPMTDLEEAGSDVLAEKRAEQTDLRQELVRQLVSQLVGRCQVPVAASIGLARSLLAGRPTRWQRLRVRQLRRSEAGCLVLGFGQYREMSGWWRPRKTLLTELPRPVLATPTTVVHLVDVRQSGADLSEADQRIG